MATLRIDTWDAEYGSSFGALEANEGEAAAPAAVLAETREWAPIRPPDHTPPTRIGFIDGVRRIDVRLFAEEAGIIAPALAGSWAVGIAISERPPSIGPLRLGRALVVGAGLAVGDLEFQVGAHRLCYIAEKVAGRAPTDPLLALQTAMRRAEAALASEIHHAGMVDLLVLDGPLTYFVPDGPVVGMIKRQIRPYLSPEQTPILALLQPGERTPLFHIGEQGQARFTWYTRIARGRPIDGAMTGIVRLETATGMGREAAVKLADIATEVLPRFATAIGRDPRAPQNLYPVARLESELHHRLGDAALIKRGLEQALWRANG